MKNTFYDLTNLFVAALQTDQLFQIIQFALATVMVLVGIAYKIWRWYKEAKADGKISEEEVKQIVKEITPDVKEAVEDVKDIVNTIKDNEK